jgi:putative DNA primase/helicase
MSAPLLKAGDWLNFLHRGGNVAHFWCATPSPTSTWFDCRKPADRKQAWGEATQFINPEQYVSINPSTRIPPSNKSGNTNPKNIAKQIEYIQCINVLHCEYDGKDWCKEGEDFYVDPASYKAMALAHIADLPYRPTLIVDSGGGYHCYWYLKDTVYIDDTNRQSVIDTQHWWVLMNGGDQGVSDITRVYRVLGTKNMKPGWAGNNPTVAAIEYDEHRLYDYRLLAEAAGEWRQATQAATSYTPSPIYTNGDKAQSGKVRDLYNSSVDLIALLESRQYRVKYRAGSIARLVRPGGETPSVTVLPADGQRPAIVVAHNTGDPLYRDGKGHDAYSAAQTLEHNGDWKAAYMEAKKAVGMWEEQPKAKGKTPTDDRRPAPKAEAKPAAKPKAPEPDTSYFLSESADDEGNAQCLYRLYEKKFCYTNANGWMANVGTHWEANNAEAALDRAIVDTLKQRRTLAVQAEAEAIVKVTRPDAKKIQATKYNYRSLVVANTTDFDNVPYFLNCKNGVVDLRTAKLYERGEAKFTYCLPIDYDRNADPADWLNFLRSITSGEEMLPYLQQCVGYSITGATNEECFFYVYGPTRSGKGTFINTIIKVLGYPTSPLCRGVAFNTFTAKREGDSQNFDLAPLKACRFISASESNKHERFDDAKVKMVTGNDPITASFKHKDSFTYIPQYKIWLLSNNPVNGDVDDDAFWYRVRVIEFPHSFAGKEDTGLKERMASPANLRAVLAWAVEGARQWYAAGRLTTPGDVQHSTQKQRDALDYVTQWLDECCTLSPASWSATSALYGSYERWCNTNGVTPKLQRGLTEALQRKGFGYEVKKINNKTIRVVIGLTLL